MDMPRSLRLTDRLRNCAALWAAATGASEAMLGRRAINDSTFFLKRLDSTNGPGTATLEKLARFLVDPGNWPEGGVPAEVFEFGHVVGICGLPARQSPDNSPGSIGAHSPMVPSSPVSAPAGAAADAPSPVIPVVHPLAGEVGP